MTPVSLIVIPFVNKKRNKAAEVNRATGFSPHPSSPNRQACTLDSNVQCKVNAAWPFRFSVAVCGEGCKTWPGTEEEDASNDVENDAQGFNG